MVASPKKESKLKGLKSFIAYQLTPTVSNIDIAFFFCCCACSAVNVVGHSSRGSLFHGANQYKSDVSELMLKMLLKAA
jgi:hypothetical protein